MDIRNDRNGDSISHLAACPQICTILQLAKYPAQWIAFVVTTTALQVCKIPTPRYFFEMLCPLAFSKKGGTVPAALDAVRCLRIPLPATFGATGVEAEPIWLTPPAWATR